MVRILLVVTSVLLITGCSYKPLIIDYAVDAPADRAAIVAATVSVLQQEGYAIALANENVGVVTTEWQDTTSGASKVVGALFNSPSGQRKQITTTVSVDGRRVVLQLTKQEQAALGGWRNARPSGRDRHEMRRLLAQIAALVRRPTRRSPGLNK